MKDDALQIVRMRNDFYRDNYRRMLGALLFMVIANVLLVFALFYIITHEPTPKYFATTADGRLIRLAPLSNPLVSQQALLQWATGAAVAVHNYDYVHFQQQFQNASQFFTPNGWKAFQKALESSGNLKTVINQKLVVKGVATGAPVVIDSGVVNGRYTWKIEVPLLVTYQSESVTFNQSVIVTMLITRVSVLEFPKGIAIAQYISQEQAGAPQAAQSANVGG